MSAAVDWIRTTQPMIGDGFVNTERYETKDLGCTGSEYSITDAGQLQLVIKSGVTLAHPEPVQFTGTLRFSYEEWLSERMWIPHDYEAVLAGAMITGIRCTSLDVMFYIKKEKPAG